MVLGASEVEIAYNTYKTDPSDENLQALIRSKTRTTNEEIQKKVYLEAIRDSKMSWEKRLEKRLLEKPNQILIDLCEQNFINHISGNTKKQLVSKLVSHFQNIPGVWLLEYSREKKQYSIIQEDVKEMSSQNIENNKSVITNPNEKTENVMTNKEEEKNVITKKKKNYTNQ